MQKILFPTDFSDNSWNAIVYAFSFFKDKSLHFHFLNVGFNSKIESSSNSHIQGLSVSNLLPKNAQEQLKELKERINHAFPYHRHTIHTHFESPIFIEGVRKVVKEMDIDLIIMGTKGASGFKEATVGSHAGSVITRVKCPTFIIPEAASYINPSRIVFPTDFNMLYKSKILRTLEKFAQFHNSSVKILRVVVKAGVLEQEQLKNRNFLGDSLTNTAHSFHKIDSPELEEGLQEFITTMDINVIAMVGKNLNFFQRLIFKPSQEKISYHTQIPFLVLHE